MLPVASETSVDPRHFLPSMPTQPRFMYRTSLGSPRTRLSSLNSRCRRQQTHTPSIAWTFLLLPSLRVHVVMADAGGLHLTLLLPLAALHVSTAHKVW